MAFHLAPPISGVYVHVGNGKHWHTANSERAGRTDCGLDLGTRYHTIEPLGPYLYVEHVCRKCAGRYLVLVEALGLVTP